MKKTFLFRISFIFLFVLLGCNSMFALELYKADAIVSYYGDKFHGKPTSSGETYNMNDLTCANKYLPFDTVLKVTNLANKKSVQVRVNDRGPFVSGRELDLSKAAAVKIDMIASGTTHVRIEIVKMGENTKLSQQTADAARKLMEKKEGKTQDKPAATSTSGNKINTSTKPTTSAAEKNVLFDIQIAAFKDKANANQYASNMIKKGFKNVVLRKSGEIYRVVIKDIPQKELARIEENLNEEGYYEFVVKKLK